MSLLNKKLLRDMRAHKAQVVAVLVIVMLGTVIFTTLLLVPRSLDSKLQHIFARTSYEDFRIEVAAAPQAATARLARLPNVTAVQGTTERDSSAVVGGKDLTLRVVSVPDTGRAEVNGLMLEAGRSLDGAPEGACLSERHLTRQFSLKPGDTARLIVRGKEMPLTIAGSVASPRFLRLVAGQNDVLSDPSQFGVIFMRQGEVQKIFGSGDYNEFAVRVSDPARLSATMKASTAVLGPYQVLGVNTGADEQSTRLIQMDLKNMKNMSLFFTLIFLWVSSLAIYIALARIIYTEQRQIGTARALGYRRGTIVKHFLSYGVFLGVVGGLAGVVAGVFVGRLAVNGYASVLGMPAVADGGMPWLLLAVGLLLAVVLCILGAVLPALRSAKIMPAASMRTDAGISLQEPSASAKRRSERTKFFPAWLRFPLRNLSRNRKRVALTAAGLVLTLATLVTVSGAIGSINFIIHKQFSQITTWDVAAFLPEPARPGFLRDVARINGVARAEPAINAPARLKTSAGAVDVSMQAYLKDTQMHGLVPAGGSPGPPGPGGILVNRSLLRQLPLAVGQEVTLDTALGPTAFRIDGFVREPLGVGCYVDLAYVQRLAGRDVFNLVLLKTEPGADARVAEVLRRMPGINEVEVKSSTLASMNSVLNRAIRPMFSVVLVMILAIGFAIVFTLVSITMLERRQEIATMLTLGWGPMAVVRSFLVETTSTSLAVVPAGIVLGWGLCWVLMNEVLSTSTTQLSPEMSLSALTVLGISVVFVLATALSVLPAAKHLSKMDLASAARERTQ